MAFTAPTIIVGLKEYAVASRVKLLTRSPYMQVDTRGLADIAVNAQDIRTPMIQSTGAVPLLKSPRGKRRLNV